MNFWTGAGVTSKNWLGGDLDHVRLGLVLGLQLPWRRFALSECPANLRCQKTQLSQLSLYDNVEAQLIANYGPN